MARKRQMLQGAAWSALSIAFSMIAMLVVGKLLTNTLDAAAVAIFALLRLGSDFFILLNNMGVATALPKIISEAAFSDRKRLLAKIFWGQSVVSVIFCLFFLSMWWSIPLPDSLETVASLVAVWPFLWLIPALVLVGTLRDTLLAGFAGLNAYKLRAIGIMVMAVAQVVLCGCALCLWPDSVVGICLAFVLAYGAIVLLLCFAGKMPMQQLKSLSVFLEVSRFSFPLYVNALVTFWALRFDTLLVGAILGKEFLGIIAIYEMAKNIPMILSRVLGAMLIPFLPNFSELHSRGEFQKSGVLLSKVLPLVSFIGYLCAFLTVLLQEALLRFLFSEDYVAAAPALGLLMVGMVLAVQAGLMGQALIAIGKTWRVTQANTIIACVSVGANTVLIPLLGIAGSGWAMVLAFSLGYFLQVIWVLRADISLSIASVLLPQLCLILGAGALLWQQEYPCLRLLALLTFISLSFLLGVVKFRDMKEYFGLLLERG